MIQKKIYTVKRIRNFFNKNMELTDDEHHQKIQNHIDVLDSVGINYWETRDKVINLAKANLYHAGLNLVINDLEDFEKNIENLKGHWVYFTDDDDWVDSNIVQVLSEVIKNYNNNLDVIVWPHIRYHSMSNIITGNEKISPGYRPVPKLQSNHCIIKITDKFINEWRPEQDIKDKTQHWNLDNYVYNSKLDLKILEIPRYLSLWNNTPISFSWHMHPEYFSLENRSQLKDKIQKFSSTIPDNTEHLIQNNPDTVFLNYIYIQQQLFI